MKSSTNRSAAQTFVPIFDDFSFWSAIRTPISSSPAVLWLIRKIRRKNVELTSYLAERQTAIASVAAQKAMVQRQRIHQVQHSAASIEAIVELYVGYLSLRCHGIMRRRAIASVN
jgi:hypothetical protein